MSGNASVEIERKWMVEGWPKLELPLLFEQQQRQGYVSVRPTVRIREENTTFSNDPNVPVENHLILCFKSQGLLSRKEIEMDIPEDKFRDLEDLIGLPLVDKVRRTYLLSDGHHLEVNHVDAGLASEFWYAEVEFASEEEARAFNPEEVGLAAYLNDDVTEKPGQSMGAYWEETRLKK